MILKTGRWCIEELTLLIHKWLYERLLTVAAGLTT
jgi:hypothetical protein